jgi:hypothetical protein
MEHIAPLIQTILWVGLIGGVLWRYDAPIGRLLGALHKRIDSGSTVKAGPFEISDQLRPQDPRAQIEKADEEIRDALQIGPGAAPPTQSAQQPAVIRASYFLAEDLVLRALQAEYGVTLSRQVTAGADHGFDGAFVRSGEFHIVEVKYLREPSRLASLRRAIERLEATVQSYGWKRVKIILAVVFDDITDAESARVRLADIAAKSSVPVEVRTYGLQELRSRFGVAEGSSS